MVSHIVVISKFTPFRGHLMQKLTQLRCSLQLLEGSLIWAVLFCCIGDLTYCVSSVLSLFQTEITGKCFFNTTDSYRWPLDKVWSYHLKWVRKQICFSKNLHLKKSCIATEHGVTLTIILTKKYNCPYFEKICIMLKC